MRSIRKRNRAPELVRGAGREAARKRLERVKGIEPSS
jgi:hypothetical protein